MPKIVINSDGTTGKTSVKLDGTTLTEEGNVVSVHFTASVQYGKWVMFAYTKKETNEDGSTILTEYRYHSPDDEEEPIIRRVKRPAGLGQPTQEDAELLVSQRTVGDELNRVVVDRSKIRPGHEGAIRELIEGRKAEIIDSGGDDTGDEDTDSG